MTLSAADAPFALALAAGDEAKRSGSGPALSEFGNFGWIERVAGQSAGPVFLRVLDARRQCQTPRRNRPVCSCRKFDRPRASAANALATAFLSLRTT
jgi:hypothetical protein